MAENPQPPLSENFDAFRRLSSTAKQADESKSWFFAVDPLSFQLVEWSSNLAHVVRIPEHQLATYALTDLLDASVEQFVREFVARQTLYALANVQGSGAVLEPPQPTFELRLRTCLQPGCVPCLLTKLVPIDQRKLLLHFEPLETRAVDDGLMLLKQLAQSVERVNAMSSPDHTLNDLLAVAREEFGKLMNVAHVGTWQRRAEQFVLTECAPALAEHLKPWTSELSFPVDPDRGALSRTPRLQVYSSDASAPWSTQADHVLPARTDLMNQLGAECCIVLSLCHGDAPWGLLVGYSEKTRCLSASEQAAGETLATMLSLQISAKLDGLSRVELEAKLETARQAGEILDAASSFTVGVREAEHLLRQAMNARGLVYVEHQQRCCFGNVPEECKLQRPGSQPHDLNPLEAANHTPPFIIELDGEQEVRLLFYSDCRAWNDADHVVGAKLRDLLLSNHRSRLAKEVCAELQRLNDDLTAFAYSVSHDLRAPLRAATQALFFLEQSLPDPPAESIVLRIARVKLAHNHLSDLIEAVLRLSRAERLEMQTEKVELSDVIDQAAEVSLGYHPSEHHYLNVLSNATLQADFVALRDVFVNLFSNALRYNRSIRKEITVGICVISGGNAPESEFGRTAIFCRDNGIGIALEHHQEVFELFRRFSPSDLVVPDGTGAGLAIVKRIVERHGGKIWIESQVGSGTTFYFTLGDNAFPKP